MLAVTLRRTLVTVRTAAQHSTHYLTAAIMTITPVPGSYYIYTPVKGASIAFAILFAISGILHIWQNNLKFKSWRIGALLPWAAVCFVVGFILREYGAYHYDKLNPFIVSQVFLFIAPPVYNGANYFIFGRALYYLPYLSLIHPGRVWSTFVTLDGIDGILAGNGFVPPSPILRPLINPQRLIPRQRQQPPLPPPHRPLARPRLSNPPPHPLPLLHPPRRTLPLPRPTFRSLQLKNAYHHLHTLLLLLPDPAPKHVSDNLQVSIFT